MLENLYPNRIYIQTSVGFPLYEDGEGFIQMGCGYFFYKDLYISVIVGLYNKGNQAPKDRWLYLDPGIELGYKYRRVLAGVFLTPQAGIGIKLGITIQN